MVCLCVLADDDVDEVVRGGLLDGLRPGSLIVVNTTTKPETCRRLAEEAAGQQLELIDAPVSGMAQGAIEGKMAIFVGGSTDQFERYEPVAGTFGTPVHTGAVGTGQAVKLLNNITSVCNAVIAQDALVIGRDLGIEPEVMAKAMSAGSAQSRWLDKYIQFGYDPLLGRDPHYFLRDWCRVLSEFQAMLRGQTVGGRLVEELGQVFVERTASHVGRR
jgi:3-hydroxyisobutyrate dehydrogenase-like beta-hydroxyacid dehydrogenase